MPRNKKMIKKNTNYSLYVNNQTHTNALRESRKIGRPPEFFKFALHLKAFVRFFHQLISSFQWAVCGYCKSKHKIRLKTLTFINTQRQAAEGFYILKCILLISTFRHIACEHIIIRSRIAAIQIDLLLLFCFES